MKDFSSISGASIYKDIKTATGRAGQTPAGEEEAAARREAAQTQGRKGCRQVRITMAFTDSNANFLRVVSKATGSTMTDLCNRIIQEYRTNNPEVYDTAIAAQKTIDALTGSLTAQEGEL